MIDLKRKNSFNLNKKEIIFLVFFALSLCLVLFLPYTIRTHDYYFHASRVEHLVKAFENGDWFPRIFPYMYDGYSYATSLFYSDFFLYIPALLTFAGMNLFTAYKIYLALVVLATVFSAYYCAGRLTGDNTAAVIAAVLYSGSSYFAVDIFIRGALGESQAFVFIPFVILGIYNTVYGDENDYKPLIIGFSGLVLSHNLSLLLTAVFFAVFLLFNLPELFRQPKRIVRIVKSTVAVVLLTAFFLLPMAEQLLCEEFFSSYHAKIWNPGKAAIRVRNLFWGANLTEDPVFTPSLGITMFIALVLCVIPFIRKPKNSYHKFFSLSVLGAFASLFACTSIFPWYPLDPHLNIVQFPSRFFMYVTLFLSFATAMFLSQITDRLTKNARIALVFGVVLVCFVQFTDTTYKGVKIALEKENIVTDTSEFEMWDENYLHANNNRQLWRERKDYIDSVRGTKGDLSADMTRDYANRYISFSGNTIENRLEVAAVYFRGYTAVNKSTGEKLPVYPSANGWVEVAIGAQPQGDIILTYSGTAIQHISPYITLATAVGIIFINYKKKKIKV